MEDPGSWWLILILLILVCGSAFFSASETALTSLNKIKLRNMVEENVKNADKIQKLIDDPNRLLSSILIGNNLVNNAAASLTTMIAVSLLGGQSGVGAATMIITIIILIFGEITPKTLASQNAEKVSIGVAKIISGVVIISTPVVKVMNLITNGLIRILGGDTSGKTPTITEAELKTMVNVSHEEGVLEVDERRMINNVFDFGENLAKDIMVPRIDMTFINVDATYDELLETFREEKYTRFPVYEESTDNVIGIINVKDLLLLEGKENFSIRDFLRQPLYTYEFKKAAELMVEMRKTLNNIVIVLDEYGATAGLITLEDMLEEIVGEIRDEYDEDEEESVVEIEPGQYRVNASLKLDDLNEYLNLKLESEDYDSLGGLVIGLLDHLPEEGEEVTHKGLRMVVEHMDKNRIETILLYLLEEDEEGGEQEEEAVEEEARRA